MLLTARAYSQQQDVDFHLSAHLLNGQKILKVKRDFHDIYLWTLGQNNSVYRVNSLTLAVEDYSSKFSAYNNFQFVDIMGLSADTVFIATNSTNVIEWMNGSLRVIGSAGGIPGTVNSLGIDLGWNLNNLITRGKMLIATDNGLRTFDPSVQKIGFLPDTGSFLNSKIARSRVYESTYRSELFKDSTGTDLPGWQPDTLHYLPVAINEGTFNFIYSGYDLGYVWIGDNTFGKNVNTVMGLNTFPWATYNEAFDEYLWGTENGMFEAAFDNSYRIEAATSKQYLKGIKVNKITNIYGLTSFGKFDDSQFTKENILAGTDNGFYFTNSGYFNQDFFSDQLKLFHDDELGSTAINDICVNAVPDAQPICENGVWLGANDGLYLLKPDYGKYINNQQQKLVSFYNHNQPDTLSQIQLCASNSVTAAVNNLYLSVQWYKDGAELPTASKDTLVITSAGDYNAVIYDPCEGIHIESNHLKVGMVPATVFTFNYPDQLQYCIGTPVTLTVAGSPGYHYQWYTNDVLNGDTTYSLLVSQPGKYKVELSTCAGSWVPSNEVNVNFISLPTPVITADKTTYCMGDNATLTENAPINSGYTINWYRDSQLLTNSTNQSALTTNIPGTYTVSLVNNTVNSDSTTCNQRGNAQSLVFNPPPTVSIKEIVTTTLCDGQSIDLLANHSSGTVKWSTGETTDQITVNTSGSYRATVSSPAGCVADTRIAVTLFPNPVFMVKDTAICAFRHQPITLTAPSGYSQYAWNGINGGQNYQVSFPQTVSLTVTDNNGCQASQQVVVADQCPAISIPNAFTPNGDGINDTWVVEGLDNDPSVLVKVFNRQGVLVYENKGYSINWNGEYGGKKLPAGTYYYILTAKNSTQKFSGPLTIIY